MKSQYLVILLLLLPPTTPAAGSKYLCHADEKVVFGCAVGKRMVSLCSSPKLGRDVGYVQYRFGTLARLELTYPEKLEPPGDKFHYSNTGYSGGGASRLRFTIAGFDYVFFDSTVRTNFKPGEPNNPAFTAGIATVQGGKVVSRHKCTDNDAGIAVPSGNVFPEEDFNMDLDL
jgi:hypothetical protein